MYIVKLHFGTETIPIHDEKQKLTSGKITKGINTIDSFSFTMLPSNIGFNEIYDYITLVSVYNTIRERYEFYGRVLYSEDNMSESGEIKKEVICESYLGFLCDSQQEYVEERNWTVGGLLEHIINTHNSQMESYKQITIGEVTVTDPNDNVYCGIQRKNTWETFKEKLLDNLGGEIRFRVDGDVIYLDYLTEIGEKSSTEITLSKNMKSIVREKDPSAIVTRLIPLGCKLKALDEDDKEVETEYRLDITPVNDGKNYIDDELAISIYGIRVGYVEFDDVTVASTLLKKGEDWLKENNKLQVGYSITALDLSLLGLDADDFDVHNWYVIKNPLIGIDDTVRVIKKSIDICEEIKSTIELGDNFETLTEAMKRQSDALGLITANYVTNKRFVNTINKTSTLIEQTEERIRLEVTAQYSDLTESYSELKLDYDAITSRVAKLEDGTETDYSEIKQTIDSITLEVSKKVNESELGTKIQQNYESVQIAWNNISKYISFANAALNIYTSEEQGDNTLLTRFNSEGISYYDEGTKIGRIGTSKWLDNESYKGLVFQLAEDARYMAWSFKDVGEEFYDIELIFHATDEIAKAGLHFACVAYCDFDLYINDDVRLHTFNDGSAGLYSDMSAIYMQSGGTRFTVNTGNFVFYNSTGLLIDCYNNIDMHTYEILNQSDARFKTNIAPTTVDALSLISQIEMKEFDWIESGEHCELGMIAQQLQTIAPAFVNENTQTGRLSIKINKFIPYLLKAIQELTQIINGNVAVMSLSDESGWIDTYTDADKADFIVANAPKFDETPVKREKIRIPINTAKGGN